MTPQRTRRLPARAMVALAAVAALSGCSVYQDLEGVEAVEPYAATVVQNADKFPNLSVVCPDDSYAVISTTREAAPVVLDRCPLEKGVAAPTSAEQDGDR